MKFAEEIIGMLGAIAVLGLILGNASGVTGIIGAFGENYNALVSGLQPPKGGK